MTCVDKLSKYTILIPCHMGSDQLTAQEVSELFFRHVVSWAGAPHSVVHDRDPRFTSTFWRSLWTRLGSRVRLSTAYHPESDGQTERQHRTIEQLLRCMMAEGHVAEG